jgi:hypothetical protein
MSEIRVKGIDKTKSKENFNSTQSQIVVDIEPNPDADWNGAFSSDWKKGELGKVAQEVIASGNHLTIRYRKGPSIEEVYSAVEKAVDKTNQGQSDFYRQIDAINARPLAEVMEALVK